MTSADQPVRPDYGLDAPNVVRNLIIAAVLGFTPAVLAAVRLWSGELGFSIGRVSVTFALVPMGLGIGVTCAAMAVYMAWSSKSGKVRERETLLDQVTWAGDERILDMGCGRGLMLIGAAKRAPRGSAVGIDLWQAEDLSGNRPEAALENARIEGVADRVRVETADMRDVPFPDASFDVIVSRAAIHNIYDPAGRAQAIHEIARLLAPGGRLILDDIRHIDEYEAALRAGGVSEVRRYGSAALAMLLTIVTFGSLRPGTIIGRKAG
jgi:arsenite methyltransferase